MVEGEVNIAVDGRGSSSFVRATRLPCGQRAACGDISWRRGIGGPTLHLVEFCLLAQERIEQAKEDWKTGKFAPVPGETEFL